jgi:hypothetical protein
MTFMKRRFVRLCIVLLSHLPCIVWGQGNFQYDQESSADETQPFPAPAYPVIQQNGPFGQSFTPSFTSIGFLRLKLYDNIPSNGLGATVYVNLRTDSISGAVLGATAPTALTDGFSGVVNFFFSTAVSVTPGTIYYLEPVVQTGDLWKAVTGPYIYPGGSLISQNNVISGSDMWFREGILVPEPSATAVTLVGIGTLIFGYVRQRRVPRQRDFLCRAPENNTHSRSE